MLEMLGKVLPIILIFTLGVITRKKKLFTDENIQGIKKLTINIALPAVLFQTFMRMDLKTEYFSLIFLTLALLGLLMLAGALLNKNRFFYNKFNPYMSTGFAFGLMGLGLFIIMYGEENLAIFSIMGLAHEMFVWIIYYTIFKLNFQKNRMNAKEFLKFLKSPILISIFLGILFNALHLNDLLQESSLWLGMVDTLAYLASSATPLILIVLGYGMSIKKNCIVKSLKLIASRVIVICIIGILFKVFVIDLFLEPSTLLDISYVSFLLLPPLFTLPLLVGEVASKEDEEVVSSAVAIATLLSIILFISYSFYVLSQ